MASSVALTIERANSTSDRAGLGSSFGSQRSYGTVKESSQPLTASGRLLCGHIEHVVHAEDTLPGLALKYEVSVHHIQRLNNLWDSETIRSRTTLKIPTYSPSTPSPKLRSKRAPVVTATTNPPRMASSLEDIRCLGEGTDGSEVRRKPSALRRDGMTPEPFQEKTIASLLTAADEKIAQMHIFNEKLALKTAHLKQSVDAYNRPRGQPTPRVSLSPSLSNHSDNTTNTTSSSVQSSLEVVAERGVSRLSKKDEERRRRLAKESSDSLSNSRDIIEDHIFEL